MHILIIWRISLIGCWVANIVILKTSHFLIFIFIISHIHPFFIFFLLFSFRIIPCSKPPINCSFETIPPNKCYNNPTYSSYHYPYISPYFINIIYFIRIVIRIAPTICIIIVIILRTIVITITITIAS